ncbi:transporter [Marisediminicola sp. LYQ85]|uniref:transporter n=1 Tax=Marisediminicola sp. LYQ85 TaxID=3391062 RepID=UPI003983C8E7
MVAHLLKLRWLLLANSLKRSPWVLVGAIFGGLYALGALAVATVGLALLSGAEPETARMIVVLAGAALIIGWVVVPLLTSGIDQTLDPSQLVTFPIPLNKLVAGLALAGLLGIPGIVTLLGALATTVTWFRYPLAAIAALVCAVIGVATCILASRLVATLSRRVAAKRRYRELVGILIFIPIILIGPILSFVGTGLDALSDRLPLITDAVSFTPLGAIWSVPADIALGDWGAAGIKFVIGLATPVVLALLWRRGLADALVTPTESGGGAATRGKLGFFGTLPASPTGAVAARALTYWIRDPRYSRQLLIVPLFPVLLIFMSSTGMSPGLLMLAGPVIAFSLSLAIYNDISFDNTAFASHIAAGLSGTADRAGRVIAVASFGVPLVVIATLATAAFSGAWDVAAPALGIALGVLLSGFGLASVSSARVVFPVPAPGDNAFKTIPGTATISFVSSFAVMGLLLLAILPELILGIIALVTGNLVLGWISLVVGVVLGAGLTVAGIRIGGRIVDRRAPELLASLTKQG